MRERRLPAHEHTSAGTIAQLVEAANAACEALHRASLHRFLVTGRLNHVTGVRDSALRLLLRRRLHQAVHRPPVLWLAHGFQGLIMGVAEGAAGGFPIAAATCQRLNHCPLFSALCNVSKIVCCVKVCSHCSVVPFECSAKDFRMASRRPGSRSARSVSEACRRNPRLSRSGMTKRCGACTAPHSPRGHPALLPLTSPRASLLFFVLFSRPQAVSWPLQPLTSSAPSVKTGGNSAEQNRSDAICFCFFKAQAAKCFKAKAGDHAATRHASRSWHLLHIATVKTASACATRVLTQRVYLQG